ncbi:MAG: tetratricopeptide repeat protein [Mariprofundus sp.]
MNQKSVIRIGMVCFGLSMVGWWLIPHSNCEALVKSGQTKAVFHGCLATAERGDAYAQNVVGVSYASGDGIAQDSKTALLWFRKSAAQGFAKAQSNIGLAYLDGAGVSRDQAAAIHWWTLAAAKGEPHAQFNLAVSLGNGYGINQDAETAEGWLLSSFFSYLRIGEFKHAFECVKYIRVLWFSSKSDHRAVPPLHAIRYVASIVKLV